MVEAAEAVSEILGNSKRVAYERIPIEGVRESSEDIALMLERYERIGYSADIASLENAGGGSALFRCATGSLRRDRRRTCISPEPHKARRRGSEHKNIKTRT